MADSSIIVSGLTATGGVGQITLNWSVTGGNCLPYLALDKVEIWEASVNNRANATKIGEILGVQYVRSGVAVNATRYYWVRPRDLSGNFGDFFPLSPTAGVSATTQSIQPAPGSIGNTELADDAVTPAKMNVTSLSAITANLGTISAGTVTGALIRTSAGSTRVEMNGSANEFRALGPNGTVVIDDGTVRATSYSTATAIEATAAGGWGVRGVASNTGTGVNGKNTQNGFGVTGDCDGAGVGVRGFSQLGPGMQAVSASGDGMNVTSNNAIGIRSYGRLVALIGDKQSGSGNPCIRADVGGSAAAGTIQAALFYNFTGSHQDIIASDDAAIDGDILVDTGVVYKRSLVDTSSVVARSSRANQKGVVGVHSERGPFHYGNPLFFDQEDVVLPEYEHLVDTHDSVGTAAVGEGMVNVCGQNGDIEVGDFIVTSDMPGKGMRQDDDIMRSCTVARAREAAVFDSPDQVKRIAVIYHAG